MQGYVIQVAGRRIGGLRLRLCWLPGNPDVQGDGPVLRMDRGYRRPPRLAGAAASVKLIEKVVRKRLGIADENPFVPEYKNDDRRDPPQQG